MALVHQNFLRESCDSQFKSHSQFRKVHELCLHAENPDVCPSVQSVQWLSDILEALICTVTWQTGSMPVLVARSFVCAAVVHQLPGDCPAPQ